jgi:MFS transporter, DHA2 family, multidrug resistance protein
VIYGLKQIAQDGISWQRASSIAAGLAVGFVFWHRQKTLESPLVDLRLFRAPAFSASLATYLLATFVAFGAYVFMGQYLQLVIGLSPLEAGFWSLPWAGSFIVGSNLTPLLARRFRPASVMVAGLAVSAVGFGLLTRVGGSSDLAVLVAGSVVYNLGLAPVFTLTNDIIIGNAPPERAGSASALSETGSELGGALGIAILGSVGTAIYRSRLAHAIPAGVPSDAAEAARSTLGGALAAAKQLSDPHGAALLGAARQAFAQAFQLTAAICTVVVLATAVMVAVLLRGRKIGSAPGVESDLKATDAMA